MSMWTSVTVTARPRSTPPAVAGCSAGNRAAVRVRWSVSSLRASARRRVSTGLTCSTQDTAAVSRAKPIRVSAGMSSRNQLVVGTMSRNPSVVMVTRDRYRASSSSLPRTGVSPGLYETPAAGAASWDADAVSDGLSGRPRNGYPSRLGDPDQRVNLLARPQVVGQRDAVEGPVCPRRSGTPESAASFSRAQRVSARRPPW